MYLNRQWRKLMRNDLRKLFSFNSHCPAPPITSDLAPTLPYSNHGHVSASHYQKKIYDLR